MLVRPNEIFIALESSYTVKDYSLADLFPYSDNKKDLDRCALVSKKAKDTKVLKNDPMPGFVIIRSGKRFYSSYNDCWYIIDPRNFAFAITSLELESILKYSGVINNVISTRCAWIRTNTGKKMRLVSEHDPDFTKAESNTQLLQQKPKKTEINLGARVCLTTGEEVRYLGSYYMIKNERHYYRSNVCGVETSGKREIYELSPGKFLHRCLNDVLNIIDNTETFTKKDATDYITNYLHNRAVCFSPYSSILTNYPNFSNETVKLVTTKKPREIEFSLEKIDKSDAIALFNVGLRTLDRSLLVLRKNGIDYIVAFPTSSLTLRAQSTSLTNFQVRKVISYHKNKINYDTSSYMYGLHDFDEYYRIKKTVNNETFV